MINESHPPTDSNWEDKLALIVAQSAPTTLLSLWKNADFNWLKENVGNLIQSEREKEREKMKITEDTSDGYHTFKELYEFRKVYNATLFNEWAKQGKYQVHKSEKHHDGEFCFDGGWFIVVATLPTGDISNHYEMKDWDLFNCRVEEKAKEWDGHTAQDVVNRLLSLSSNKPSNE